MPGMQDKYRHRKSREVFCRDDMPEMRGNDRIKGIECLKQSKNY